MKPLDCAKGHECVNGKPFACQSGSFNDKLNHPCSTCSDGFASFSEGSITCEACLEGEICRNGFKMSCERGYLTIPKNMSDSIECSICPSGHYCPINRNEAVPCPAGSFNPAIGSFIFSDCRICPVGSYCPEGSSMDKKCGDDEIFFCPEGSSLPKRYEQTLQFPRSVKNVGKNIRAERGLSSFYFDLEKVIV